MNKIVKIFNKIKDKTNKMTKTQMKIITKIIY